MDIDAVLNEWRNKAWDKARGIESADYNNDLLLVRASVEEVGQALTTMYPDDKWSKDVLGREIELARNGIFIFRLTGHTWTEVLPQNSYALPFGAGNLRMLSRRLNTRVISYCVGDTAGVAGDILYDKVKLSSPSTARRKGSSFIPSCELYLRTKSKLGTLPTGFFWNKTPSSWGLQRIISRAAIIPFGRNCAPVSGSMCKALAWFLRTVASQLSASRILSV